MGALERIRAAARRIAAFAEWMGDLRGTGWCGHDSDMPRGGYDGGSLL